ncbi:MAG: hypothetical protein ACOYK9_05065 [Chlamydiia bacterium]
MRLPNVEFPLDTNQGCLFSIGSCISAYPVLSSFSSSPFSSVATFALAQFATFAVIKNDFGRLYMQMLERHKGDPQAQIFAMFTCIGFGTFIAYNAFENIPSHLGKIAILAVWDRAMIGFRKNRCCYVQDNEIGSIPFIGWGFKKVIALSTDSYDRSFLLPQLECIVNISLQIIFALARVHPIINYSLSYSLSTVAKIIALDVLTKSPYKDLGEIMEDLERRFSQPS